MTSLSKIAEEICRTLPSSMATPSSKRPSFEFSVEMGPLPSLAELAFEKGAGFVTPEENKTKKKPDDIERGAAFLAYVASQNGTLVHEKDLEESQAEQIYAGIAQYYNRERQLHPMVVEFIEFYFTNRFSTAGDNASLEVIEPFSAPDRPRDPPPWPLMEWPEERAIRRDNFSLS